ncbi:DNA-binding protein [Candidatus Nanohalococcus occultus]|uniref:DNA-binding TFAR19-related protein, PDSD5 family n=1 Tax=Candidatus Nanohalococcus occultus TaxID=2978047 RepID=A0ABY8CDW6_9ARCH|nr:DNA-binding TFAR19-related protein, PDSD5 family [Candidatus Nanohaloarchaeota archaeon SVXNc]
MSDSEDELEKLREQKREQLQNQDGEDQAEQQRQQIKNQASKYLTSEAQSRLGNIRAADPEKASAIEMQLAQMGRAGRVKENSVTDERLKNILEQLSNEQSKNQGSIKFRR